MICTSERGNLTLCSFVFVIYLQFTFFHQTFLSRENYPRETIDSNKIKKKNKRKLVFAFNIYVQHK